MTFPISADGTGFNAGASQAVRKLDNLSIVTRYKAKPGDGRKQQMLASLQTWLKLPVAQIVICDWSNEDGELKDLVKYLDTPLIKIVGVEKKRDFNRSAAWNLAIANADAEWVMCLDADLLLINPTYFNDPMFSSENYEMYFRFFWDKKMPQMFGSCVMLKDQWAAVGGFHEGMTGWGWEDVDFYRRMAKRYEEKTIGCGAFNPQNHLDDSRVTFHDEKDLRFSSLKNAYRAHATDKLELIFSEGKTVAARNINTRVTDYHQKISYKWDPEPLLASPEFVKLAKRYNVFTTPADQIKLFKEPEFVELEKKHKVNRKVTR